MRLAEATWTELDGRHPLLLLLPVGSCEQHGPHLPLDTDTAVALDLATRAAATLGAEVMVAPALPYGASGEHEAFPGTVSIGHDALGAVLLELVRSATRWCGRVLVVNGHGGNVATIASTALRLRGEGRDTAWWTPAIPDGDAHAGRTETALMLATRPDSVRPERPPGAVAPIAELMPRLRAHGVRPVSPNGVLGDPADATATEGAHLRDGLVADLVAAVRRWRPDHLGRVTG